MRASSSCSRSAFATALCCSSRTRRAMTTSSAGEAAALRGLTALADPEAARFAQRFFKTGPGEYGEGDVFLGIRVPFVRQVARSGDGLRPGDVLHLLRSRFHEERLLALILLVRRFERGTESERQKIVDVYLGEVQHINNWDLVDVSAPA